jgi:glycerophosphoryl diester phosphodiesterase
VRARLLTALSRVTRVLILLAIGWLAVAALALLELWPSIPKTQEQWVLLIALGPPSYVLLQAFGERLIPRLLPTPAGGRPTFSLGRVFSGVALGVVLVAAMIALAWLTACSGIGFGGRDLSQRLAGRLVDAHRGGFRYGDSNTIARFEAARRAGADMIETDLRLSKDGVVFLFHDGDLAPNTVCSGPLASHTAAELERCTLRGLDHGPDRFEDMLRWDAGRVMVDADLKAREVVGPALELVRRFAAYEWVVFEAGDGLPLYREIRAADPRIAVQVGPALERGEAGMRELLELRDPRLAVIGLRPDTLTGENVSLIHAAGKRSSINAWLLAEERIEPVGNLPRTASCAEAFRRGADIAVTNDPEECVRQRDAIGR